MRVSFLLRNVEKWDIMRVGFLVWEELKVKLVGFVETKFFKNDFFKDVLKVVAKTPLSDSEVVIFGVVLELLQKKCIQ